jgi:hypothetical protein
MDSTVRTHRIPIVKKKTKKKKKGKTGRRKRKNENLRE